MSTLLSWIVFQSWNGTVISLIRNGTSITITSLHAAKSSVKRTIFFAHEIVKCMGKNLDIANFRWSIFCQYLWLSLYRGSTVWRLRNACGHVGILLWVKLSVNLLTVITLVMGRKDYCSSLLFNVPATHIAKNPRVQNCLARLVCRTPKFDHITPTLIRMNEWMNEEWMKSRGLEDNRRAPFKNTVLTCEQ